MYKLFIIVYKYMYFRVNNNNDILYNMMNNITDIKSIYIYICIFLTYMI